MIYIYIHTHILYIYINDLPYIFDSDIHTDVEIHMSRYIHESFRLLLQSKAVAVADADMISILIGFIDP